MVSSSSLPPAVGSFTPVAGSHRYGAKRPELSWILQNEQYMYMYAVSLLFICPDHAAAIASALRFVD